jgi:hypothetical protein
MHYKLLKVTYFETALLHLSVLQTKTVTAMEAKTHMDPCFTLVGGWLIPPTLLQVSVGLLANLASISPGMNLGFSAVALPAMQTAVTDDEASWIGKGAAT